MSRSGFIFMRFVNDSSLALFDDYLAPMKRSVFHRIPKSLFQIALFFFRSSINIVTLYFPIRIYVILIILSFRLTQRHHLFHFIFFLLSSKYSFSLGHLTDLNIHIPHYFRRSLAISNRTWYSFSFRSCIERLLDVYVLLGGRCIVFEFNWTGVGLSGVVVEFHWFNGAIRIYSDLL